MGEIEKLELWNYDGVGQFKSVRRAIRRGLMSKNGYVYPRRPFNNRKNKPLEDLKRSIYKELKFRREYGEYKETGI